MLACQWSWEPKREPSPSLSLVTSYFLQKTLGAPQNRQAGPWAGWSKRGSDSPHMVRTLETWVCNEFETYVTPGHFRSLVFDVWKRSCQCSVFVLPASIAWTACRLRQMTQNNWAWRINLANFKQNNDSYKVRWQPPLKYPCKWHRIKCSCSCHVKVFRELTSTATQNTTKMRADFWWQKLGFFGKTRFDDDDGNGWFFFGWFLAWSSSTYGLLMKYCAWRKIPTWDRKCSLCNPPSTRPYKVTNSQLTTSWNLTENQAAVGIDVVDRHKTHVYPHACVSTDAPAMHIHILKSTYIHIHITQENGKVRHHISSSA